jgi:hypothetical protein
MWQLMPVILTFGRQRPGRFCVRGQPELHSKTLFQNNNQKKKERKKENIGIFQNSFSLFCFSFFN